MQPARGPALLVTLAILAALVLAGPTWAEPTELGEGTASVEVVSPTWLDAGTGSADHRLVTTPGRFGTRAVYLRTPDLVVDVENVTGQPALYYTFGVPELGIDRPPVRRLLTESGRYRVHLSDVALPPADYAHSGTGAPSDGRYTGRLTVRVQSFSGSHVVVNRTVEVVLRR